jgi:hypothetical protein
MRNAQPIPMRYLTLSALLAATLSACTTPPRRVTYAPPAEAAAVEFPSLTVSTPGLQRLDGNMAASIQLAMDDFLPWDAPPPPSSPIHEEPCLRRRESYDVTAVPAPEGVMLVRFNLNTDICKSTDQLINIVTYAVDIRTMRILSREMHTRPNPIRPQPPAAPSQVPDAGSSTSGGSASH